MSTSRTTTTTHNSAGPSRSRPAAPPPPATPIGQENEDLGDDEDEILRRAHERVRRIREQKAAAAAKKKAKEEVAKKAAEEVHRKRMVAAQELEERRRLMAEAATARSQRGTSPSEMSASPRRPVVEIRRKLTNKGKGKAKAQPVGGDPDDGDDGDDDDDDEEENRAPCERCKNKKLPCQMQAGKRSSIICKPCHDAKVRCSYSGRPTTSKQREGGSGERIAVLESQMAQSLADSQALREADSKTHQYLRQLLRRQEDDHARLIAMETRMAMMGMGGGSATAGPSRGTTERRRCLLKRQRIVRESDEEEEEEKEVEEKEAEVEKDGEGEEEEMGAEEEGEGEAPAPTAATTVTSDKGKERALQ
ncbi:hypothetical protein GG344DRAFT_83435 [Lentinula edodes]|nr:hypothetical protein GG344DRAFT_83435 [Lentinula edodes]